jgi:DMSO/TMAO reductase YedYZ molybdopterin-dependent catalytic subunit
MLDEQEYFAAREEQLLRQIQVERGLSRRQLLKLGASSALVLPFLGGFARVASAAQQRRAAIVNGFGNPFVQDVPSDQFTILGTNAEMRWDAAQGLPYTIPNDRFFIRDHTMSPVLDVSSWTLDVYGTGLDGSPDVTNPVQFGYQDLLDMPAHTITCYVECAGNGRSFYGSQQGTPAAGSQWHLGGVGVADWTGVPLSFVLKRAGINDSAVDVMPAGLDPEFVSGGVDSGHVRRPMSADKAMDDVLLAYQMNGQALPYDHGFPLRAIVPGWIGIANIKWVGSIQVSATPLFSLWNTKQYVLTGGSYPPGEPPITTQVIKSAFELPFNATLPVNQQQTLTGRSWSPFAGIRTVEISTDGGNTWTEAPHTEPNIAQAWTQWSFIWTPTVPGNYNLMARATDKKKNVQPVTSPFNTGGYLFGAIVKHPVTVA